MGVIVVGGSTIETKPHGKEHGMRIAKTVYSRTLTGVRRRLVSAHAFGSMTICKGEAHMHSTKVKGTSNGGLFPSIGNASSTSHAPASPEDRR